MTVSALITRNDITATASQTSFAYTFRVLAATDMDVYQNGVLLSSGYTVNNVGTTTGGTVVLDTGVPVGQIVSLVLAMPLDRTTDYQNSGKFLAGDVNGDFDKIYIGAIQNENLNDRSLRLKDVEPPTSGVDMTLPLKADRKGKYLSFNSVTGAPEVVAGTGGNVTDASLVNYTPAGTGAVVTTVQAKLRETVSVKDFGADSTGSTSSKDAIQAAIDTGKDVFFPEGNYLAAGLTVNNNQQSFTGVGGNTRITKNANGTIISGSGDDLYFGGLDFRGAASSFTGDNISLTGNRITFIDNSGSSDAHGRALKSTGSQIGIYGGHNTWATTATGATDYDIEIGVSGTATLYHYITGVKTGHANGGILFVDCGSQAVVGCQVGKLNISKGTGPSGTNGGNVIGNRIIGDVTVALPSATFSSNTLGANLAFLLGTSQCRFDASNILNGTATNAGNANNLIVRETSSGGTTILSFGPSAASADLKIDPSSVYYQWRFGGSVVVPNNTSVLGCLNAAGNDRFSVGYVSSGDDMTLGANTGAGNFTTVAAGTGGLYMLVGAASRFQATESQFRPVADNAYSLGNASQRFSVVYAGTGTINTSDERTKTELLDLDSVELAVAKELKGAIKKFKFKDVVADKKDSARIHIGVGAQTVKSIFESHGLVAENYAILCYDEWEDKVDKSGVVTKLAGNRYGIRYDELLAFIVAAL